MPEGRDGRGSGRRGPFTAQPLPRPFKRPTLPREGNKELQPPLRLVFVFKSADWKSQPEANHRSFRLTVLERNEGDINQTIEDNRFTIVLVQMDAIWCRLAPPILQITPRLVSFDALHHWEQPT